MLENGEIIEVPFLCFADNRARGQNVFANHYLRIGVTNKWIFFSPYEVTIFCSTIYTQKPKDCYSPLSVETNVLVAEKLQDFRGHVAPFHYM